MEKSPYSDLAETDLGLRDRLAVERTVLANERTLLAYVRTALALAVVGVTALHLFEHLVVDLLGGLLVVSGFGTFGVGWTRFRRTRRRISHASPA